MTEMIGGGGDNDIGNDHTDVDEILVSATDYMVSQSSISHLYHRIYLKTYIRHFL